MKGTKRFAAALTAVFTASALVMSASAAAHNYRGDINRDDKVDGTDVAYLQKYIANKGYISDKNLVYADVNGDGNINVIDLILLKRLANSKATPEEVAVTTPTVTTAVTTTSTTSSTAAPTKVSTAATTKATTTTTTTAKATTAATTKATTTTTKATTKATTTTRKATTAATTTTSTTKATTAATTTTSTTKATTKATTTTTTTKATTKATTTTTTTTTKATTASTTKATTLATVNNGINSLAAKSADRGWIVLGGDASQCDYVSNASDFLPGSVRMPAITGDGTYIAEFYITDEALAEHDGGITYASLDILKGGTWSAYSMEEKPNLKVTITGAIIDGRNVDVSGLTQNSGAASVHIESILGMCNSVNLEFKVEGFNDTAVSTSVSSETTTTTTTTTTTLASGNGQNKVAATNVVRGNITLGGNAADCDYVKNINDFVNGSVEMPEISGSGTYTAKFTLKNPQGIYYAMLDVLKPNSYDCYTQQDSGYVSVKVKSAKVNGELVAQSKIDGLEESTYFSHVNITDLFFDNYNPINIESLEITFEVSAPSASGSSSGSSGSDSQAPSSGSANIAGTDKNRLILRGAAFGWGKVNYQESDYGTQLGAGSTIPEITGDGTYTITIFTDQAYGATSSDFEIRAMNGSGNDAIIKANYPNLKLELIGITADGTPVESTQVNEYNWGSDSTGFNVYNAFMQIGVENFFTVTVKISGLDG